MRPIGVYQAARVLDLTPPTVYGMIKRGLLAGYRDRLTGRIYLDGEEVERLALERRLTKIAGHQPKAGGAACGKASCGEKADA